MQQLRLALIGAGDESDVERALDPKERKALMEAELVWNQTAKARGELVLAADVERTFDAVLSLVRSTVSSWPDRLQRELGLDPAQLGRAIAQSDDLISAVRLKLQAFVAGDGSGQDSVH